MATLKTAKRHVVSASKRSRKAPAKSRPAAAPGKHKPGCALLAGGCCTCGAPMTLEEKERSNTWDHLSDFVKVWKARQAGGWQWYANANCKYVELRIDMRTGHCIIRDRHGKRIDPAQLAYQYSTDAAAAVTGTDALNTTEAPTK